MTSSTLATFKIHPAIGIARVGESETDFYLAPESQDALPIKCNIQGTPVDANGYPVAPGNAFSDRQFRDDMGYIKRQAARFKIYQYDDEHPQGRQVKIGDQIQGVTGYGKLQKIEWSVYLANKNSSWFQCEQLQGEHGYPADHPLRNPDITDAETRQRLITNPGPYIVASTGEATEPVHFARNANPDFTQNFPPEDLAPFTINSLGRAMINDHQDFIVLGGAGKSGSFKKGFGHPQISHYANNDGWFDDVADGPVSAILYYFDEVNDEIRQIEVSDPAWVIVGPPAYAPQIPNMINMDDLIYDLSVREFGYNPYLYGPDKFDNPEPVDCEDDAALLRWRQARKKFNPHYLPYFEKEIQSILIRPFMYQWVTDFLQISNDAHGIHKRADFDLSKISKPPKWVNISQTKKAIAQLKVALSSNEARTATQNSDELAQQEEYLSELLDAQRTGKHPTKQENGDDFIFYDPYKDNRLFIYESLRQDGEENILRNHRSDPNSLIYGRSLMPALSGDNPISNVLPRKFLRLTDTQLFLLHQWALGRFINESEEKIDANALQRPLTPQGEGVDLDRGVLTNLTGGAFCPGAEAGWIMRNPGIYTKPYRIFGNREYFPIGTGRLSGRAPFQPPALTLEGDISNGLEPGDITKFSALPWQADFNECSTQNINVSYSSWNVTYNNSTNATTSKNDEISETLWWPAYRPMQVYTLDASNNKKQVDWARGIPQTNAGDLKMVSAWRDLGFVLGTVPKEGDKPYNLSYYEVERKVLSDDAND